MRDATDESENARQVIYVDLQTLQPLFTATFDTRDEMTNVGIFAGRWSETREDYPRWPDDAKREIRVLDSVGAAFANLAESRQLAPRVLGQRLDPTLRRRAQAPHVDGPADEAALDAPLDRVRVRRPRLRRLRVDAADRAPRVHPLAAARLGRDRRCEDAAIPVRSRVRRRSDARPSTDACDFDVAARSRAVRRRNRVYPDGAARAVPRPNPASAFPLPVGDGSRSP